MIELLLIEHDPDNAEQFVQALQRVYSDVSIQWVQSNQEALDYLFATGLYKSRMVQLTPKLIFLALTHPMDNPLEIIPILKSYARTSSLPVVAIVDKPDNTATLAGVNTCIIRGYDTEKFIQTLELVSIYWLTHANSEDQSVQERSNIFGSVPTTPKVYQQ